MGEESDYGSLAAEDVDVHNGETGRETASGLEKTMTMTPRGTSDGEEMEMEVSPSVAASLLGSPTNSEGDESGELVDTLTAERLRQQQQAYRQIHSREVEGFEGVEGIYRFMRACDRAAARNPFV